MLKRIKFGKDYNHPGEFRNLDGEEVNPLLSNLEIICAENRNKRITEVVSGVKEKKYNYPESTKSKHVMKELLSVKKVSEARTKIELLSLSAKKTNLAKTYLAASKEEKSMKKLKEYIVKLHDLQ